VNRCLLICLVIGNGDDDNPFRPCIEDHGIEYTVTEGEGDFQDRDKIARGEAFIQASCLLNENEMNLLEADDRVVFQSIEFEGKKVNGTD